MKSGQSMLIISVLLAVILGFSLVTTTSVLSHRQFTKQVDNQLITLNLAEAGINKALWCLNQTTNNGCGSNYGPNYSGESNVDLETGTFTTVVTGSGNERIVESTGQLSNGLTKRIRVVATATPSTTNISLSYATQIGDQGLTLNNNATINGDVFSNGPIICGTGARITGNATAADPIPGNGNDDGSKIEGCEVGIDAKAYRLKNSAITADAYYKVLENTNVSGTSYPNSPEPATQPFPIDDAKIQSWKNDAAAGGTISGNHAPPATSSLGPKKITGDLILENGETLTVTGTIWVEGKIIIGNSATIELSSNYGNASGTVIADGQIDVGNTATLAGSGNSSSFLIAVSLNNSTAINIGNGGTGSVYYAPYGTITLGNGASVQEISARKVILNNGVTLTYNAGLVTTGYSSSTTGGRWVTKKGTWVVL